MRILGFLVFAVSALVVVRGAQSPTDTAAVVGVDAAGVTTAAFLEFFAFLVPVPLGSGCGGWLAFPGPPAGA